MDCYVFLCRYYVINEEEEDSEQEDEEDGAQSGDEKAFCIFEMTIFRNRKRIKSTTSSA